MALPRMDADPSARPRVRPAQPVTAATCVHEARAWFTTTGERATVVYRSGRPFGVLTASAVARATECGQAHAPVTKVMDYVTVPVHRDLDAHDTVRSFTDAAWSWLRDRSC
jgi:predicted transcriptional regulator